MESHGPKAASGFGNVQEKLKIAVSDIDVMDIHQFIESEKGEAATIQADIRDANQLKSPVTRNPTDLLGPQTMNYGHPFFSMIKLVSKYCDNIQQHTVFILLDSIAPVQGLQLLGPILGCAWNRG